MSIWKLLGIESSENSRRASNETETVRKITAAMDKIEPDQARFLACFAYILSRVAHADQQVSPEETEVMERLVASEGQIPGEQAVIVVQMAKTQSVLFGGIEDYVVTREFNKIASPEQKKSLLHCLYAVSAVNQSVSSVEESAIRQIASELKLRRQDFIATRLHFKEHLDILKSSPPETS